MAPRGPASSSIAAASTAACGWARRSGRSSTPSGGRGRCATTRAPTCSTARCATSSGSARRQAGSLVTPEGLRFDFPFERGVTSDELRAIEAEVRRIIRDARTVTPSVTTMEEAVAAGADAFFDEKYGERVRTVRVDGYSHELCGGTHCSNTGQIGGFVITGERSIGTGMRRIEALTGDAADAWLAARIATLDKAAEALGAQSIEAVPDRIAALQEELREAKRRLKAGGGGGVPRAGRARGAGASSRRPECASSPSPDRSPSIDAVKAAAKDVRGVLRVRRHRPRPRRRTSRSSSSRSATTSSPVGSSAGKLVQAAVAGDRRPGRRAAPPWPRARAPNGKASPAALAAVRRGARGIAGRWPSGAGSGSATSRSALAACTALDIGTEFAKALVFEIDEDGHGTIRGVGRKRQGLSHMQSGTVADIAAVVDNCSVALQEAEEMAGFRPTQVVIGIAGELVKGFTTTHAQERKKPDSAITEAELQRLIDGVQREALREAERAITWETGLPQVDVRLVHAAITGASIDGYALTNPVGFQGRHVPISIFNAFAPLVHLGALQSVASQLDLELLEVVAEPYAVARVLGRRPGPPGRGALHRRRRRDDGRRPRPPGRDRGHADVRPRRAGVHEVARRPARPAVPASRGAQGGLRPRPRHPPSARRGRRGHRRGRRGLGGRRRARHGGARGAATSCPAGSTCAAAARACPRSARPSAPSGSGSACRSPGRPRSRSWRPTRSTAITDATDLLVDQQDVTPLGLAYQAIELQTDEDPLDAALRRVLRAMKV